MTDLESCSVTAPSPYLEALVCRVVGLPGLKYGSVIFLDISSFVLEKATCTDSLSSNSTFCLQISLRGSLNSAKCVQGNSSLSPHLGVNSSFSLLQFSLDLD